MWITQVIHGHLVNVFTCSWSQITVKNHGHLVTQSYSILPIVNPVVISQQQIFYREKEKNTRLCSYIFRYNHGYIRFKPDISISQQNILINNTGLLHFLSMNHGQLVTP